MTLVTQSKLPFSFLWEAFQTASFLINRMPTPILGNLSLFQKLHHQLPDYKFPRVFSCACFPLLRTYNQHKLDFYTKKCTLIGYSPLHKRYKCLDKSGKMFVARHITFNESKFPFPELFSKQSFSKVSDDNNSPPGQVTFFHKFTSPDSSNAGPLDNSPAPALSLTSSSGSAHVSSSTPSSIILSYSISLPKPTHHMITRAKADIFKPKTYLAVTKNLEPDSVKAALQDSKWLLAMKEEFEALQRNHTWTLVLHETTSKIVGIKWVYRVKYHPDGSISKYKTRLVAKGYHQTQMIDFFETFNPVVKPCTIRIVLSLAVMKHWPIRRLDVNNAFLNGVLQEDVFMHQL